MTVQTPLAECFGLFDDTIASMNWRLARVRHEALMMSALRWGMDELDRT